MHRKNREVEGGEERRTSCAGRLQAGKKRKLGRFKDPGLCFIPPILGSACSASLFPLNVFLSVAQTVRPSSLVLHQIQTHCQPGCAGKSCLLALQLSKCLLQSCRRKRGAGGPRLRYWESCRLRITAAARALCPSDGATVCFSLLPRFPKLSGRRLFVYLKRVEKSGGAKRVSRCESQR